MHLIKVLSDSNTRMFFFSSASYIAQMNWIRKTADFIMSSAAVADPDDCLGEFASLEDR